MFISKFGKIFNNKKKQNWMDRNASLNYGNQGDKSFDNDASFLTYHSRFNQSFRETDSNYGDFEGLNTDLGRSVNQNFTSILNAPKKKVV